MKQTTDVIVIGAGHAGLSAGYYLSAFGLPHYILERGRVGESWLSQRWDSFRLNTARSINSLPEENNPGNPGGGFSTATEFVDGLKNFVQKFKLPVIEQCEVISVDKDGETGYFTIAVSNQGVQKFYYAKQVIVCSGAQNVMQLPAFSQNIGPEIQQMHAGEYRNPTQLSDGAVLVVGSAQSGCQIAEDLVRQGREVFLSTSLVPRLPRRYRGRDIMDWLIDMKYFDKTAAAAQKEMHIRAPQLSAGTETISLQSLAKKGVRLLGKLNYADSSGIHFYDDAAEHVQFADQISLKVKGMIDEFINQIKYPATAIEKDENDLPDPTTSCVSPITALTFSKSQIRTIIWATGFGGNFDYLKLPLLDIHGMPEHVNGITRVKGLYFLGLPWLRTRKSGLVAGIQEDAEFICGEVLRCLFQVAPKQHA